MYRCTDVYFDCFLFALTDNQIGDEGVRALAEALKTNKTLLFIKIGGKKCVDVRMFSLIVSCLRLQTIKLVMRVPKP
jgi:hypothetical protein